MTAPTPPAYSNTYPSGGATPVPVNPEQWTVSQWLKSPTVINNFVRLNIAKNFLGGYLLRQSPANAGVVIFNEAALEDQFIDSTPGAPGPLEVPDGAEFPEVGFTAQMQTVLTTKRRGAKFRLNRTQIRRDNRDLIGQGMQRVANTLVRNEDRLIIATVRNHPRVLKVPVSVPWNGTNPLPVADITAGKSSINQALGGDYYHADTGIINPDTATYLSNMAQIWQRLPRENAALNPLFSSDLGGLLNLNWVTKAAQPAGEITFCQSQALGVLGTEIPQYTDVWEDKDTEDSWFKTARVNVPAITDPLAAYVLTGIFG